MIQVVLLDETNFITQYKTFPNDNYRAIGNYIVTSLKDDKVIKVEIKKWKDQKDDNKGTKGLDKGSTRRDGS